jgi:hypothetical protein
MSTTSNQVLFGIDVKENSEVAGAAAPRGTFGCEAGDIPAERVLLQGLQSGPNLPLVLSGSF